MHDVTAEQLVFLDESIFKAQTGWQCMAYAPISVSSGVSSAATVGVRHKAVPRLSRIRLSMKREQNPVPSIQLSISIDPTSHDCLLKACDRGTMTLR